MNAWFASLEARERAFVAAAGVFIVFAAFWFGIWVPLDTGQKAAADRVDTWRQGLTALRPMKGQIQASATGQTAVTGQNQSLVVIVDNSLRQRGLYSSLQRSQPTPAGNGIRVEFESAAFDDERPSRSRSSRYKHIHGRTTCNRGRYRSGTGNTGSTIIYARCWRRRWSGCQNTFSPGKTAVCLAVA